MEKQKRSVNDSNSEVLSVQFLSGTSHNGKTVSIKREDLDKIVNDKHNKNVRYRVVKEGLGDTKTTHTS